MLARTRFVSSLVFSLFVSSVAVGCATETADSSSSERLASNDPATDLALASWSAHDARDANTAKDDLLARLLSRVAPALDDRQQKAVVEAFEARDDVKAARVAYLQKSHDLANKLDAIHRDPTLAKQVSLDPGLLMAAYEQLAETPFAAGAVRFAGVLLDLKDDSPYANVKKQLGNVEVRAAKLLYVGLASALVERSIARGDVDQGLGDLREYLATANGRTSTVLAVIADRKTVLEKSRLGGDVVVAGADIAPAVRAMGGVLSVWAAAEDVKNGDVAALLQSGPEGAAALLEGTNALREALGASKLVWAEDAAKVAGKLSAGVGVVMATVAAVNGLRDLSSTDAKVRTLGNCLVLAGSFIALTGGSGALLVAAGTAATILADILESPKPDELRPLLQAAADRGVLPAEAVAPLANAKRENVQLLARDFGLTPAQVQWTIVRSPGAAGSDLDLYRSLRAISGQFALTGASMDALLRKIAGDADAKTGEMVLSDFLQVTWDRSKLWGSRETVLGELAAISKDLRADAFDAEDYGIDAATQLAKTKTALAAARALLVSAPR